MNEQDNKPHPKKLKKLNKKVNKMKTMIKELHRDRFGYRNEKVEAEVEIHKSSRNLTEDSELEKMVKSFLDLVLEYSGALENTKINNERDIVIVNGNYYNNDSKTSSSKLQGEYYYEISIGKESVSFYGNVFEGIDSFSVKSDIHEIYSDRLINLSNELRRQGVSEGFNKIYQISNLNRGRSMKALEDSDL